MCLTSGGSYTSSVNVQYTSATLLATTIYVRLKAGLSADCYSGENITNNGGGVASAVNVTCNGYINTTFDAQMTGALINSCDDASCTEGYNEILFFNSGPCPIDVSNSVNAAANIKVYYEKQYPPTANYTESFVSEPTIINSFNSLAYNGGSGCTSPNPLFIDALTEGTIPENAIFFITREDLCYPYDFVDFCDYGPIYVLFSSDGTWSVDGNFANISDNTRYFKTIINSIGGATTTIDYSYETADLTEQDDGDAISFPVPAVAEVVNPACAYFNNGCVPPTTVLPVNLFSFNVECINNIAKIKWSTASETNSDYFTIEKSTDAIDWNVIKTVPAAGYSNTIMNYSYTDDDAADDKYYYRLKQTDFDGNFEYFEPIAVSCDDENSNYVSLYPNPANNQVICSVYSSEETSLSVEIANYLGQKIYTSTIAIGNGFNTIPLNVSQYQSGIYYVVVRSANGKIMDSKQLVVQ